MKVSSWVRSITYGSLPCGTHQGALAFQIDFAGPAWGAVPDEIASIVDAIVRWPQGPEKIVALRGDFSDEAQTDYLTLLAALSNRGYYRIAVVDGQLYYPWFALTNWIVAELRSPVWPVFQVQEIRYWPPAEATSPSLPAIQPALYLAPGELTPRNLVKFLTESPAPWRLLLPTKSNLKQILYDEGAAAAPKEEKE